MTPAWCAALAVALAGCARVHGGVPSDHFDGTRFSNPEGDAHSFGDLLRWLWEMETVQWPSWVVDPPRPAPVERAREGQLRATYVNHATVLIQVDGLNILTDPIWSVRAGPTSWLGPRRVRSPGVAFDALPKIDVVLVSHDHYDHLDLPTVERLWERDHPVFVVGLGLADALAKVGIPREEVRELDWWQETRVGPRARIVLVPARHGSGRGPFSGGRTLWGGFVVDVPAGEIYFAGDTGHGAFVDAIAARFRRIRLAILPLGSYEKRWFMRAQHLNPDDAVRIHGALGAEQSLGMHYATFAEHPEQRIDAHERDLAAALAAHGVAHDRFWLLGFGEGRDVRQLGAARAP